jgi:hypothetical protein
MGLALSPQCPLQHMPEESFLGVYIKVVLISAIYSMITEHTGKKAKNCVATLLENLWILFVTYNGNQNHHFVHLTQHTGLTAYVLQARP